MADIIADLTAAISLLYLFAIWMVNVVCVADDLAHWPCVLMEVCSLDSWDRHRVEGYGHLPLPSSPGTLEHIVYIYAFCIGSHLYYPSITFFSPESGKFELRKIWGRDPQKTTCLMRCVCVSGVHEVEVGTWRPSGTPVVDTLRRFFVGGASRLREMSYISRPSDFEVSWWSNVRVIGIDMLRSAHHSQGRHLSRYGFQTESSGTVDFRFNIIHQSRYIQHLQMIIMLLLSGCSSSVQRFQSEQLNHAISR